MGDQEETQEQMKADMSALKEQMASMLEAMLGMRQLMEKNVTTATAISSAAEARAPSFPKYSRTRKEHTGAQQQPPFGIQSGGLPLWIAA